MAPVPLNISPAFRPWRQAGITHLLLDDEVRERLLARPEPEPSEAAPPVRQHSAPPQRGERRQPQPPSYTPPPQPQPVSSAPQKPVRIADTDTLAPDVWPAYWQTLLKKTPPRPSLVWSYPSLSRDLGGDADAAHRDFLRRLLGDMALPKGSHAFWPLNRYPYGDGESEQTVDARMFFERHRRAQTRKRHPHVRAGPAPSLGLPSCARFRRASCTGTVMWSRRTSTTSSGSRNAMPSLSPS